MADDDIDHSETNHLGTTKLDTEQTSVLAAAPAAPVDTVHDKLSSDVNHILATTLPHPAVVPEYDDISDKLFGDFIQSNIDANYDPRITTLETLPVPSPVPAPSPLPRPRTNLLVKKQSPKLAIPRPMS